MAAFEHQWPVTPKLIPARLASARTSVVTRRRHRVDYASSSRLAVHADAGAIQYRSCCYTPLEQFLLLQEFGQHLQPHFAVVHFQHRLLDRQWQGQDFGEAIADP